jgi:SAM-dependent methyltransferase
MTHHDAVALIDTPWLHSKTPLRWADLGCGSGTFTLALADLLAPGSSIEAIDLRPSIAPRTTKNGVAIHPRTADFTTLEIRLRAGIAQDPDPNPAPNPNPASSPDPALNPNPISNPRHAAPAAAAPLPDRLWPGTQPLIYDGILMANSLHYVRDQGTFLARLLGAPSQATRPGVLLLVEYDTDVPVARWVPYPLSFTRAAALLKSSGWSRVQKLGTYPSAFGRTELYAALALPEE